MCGAGVCECIKVCRWRYSGGMCRAGVCQCIKVAGGGTVEACVVLVCVSVYKGGRWRYSGGMCRAGVCVSV